jgi:hypothetical protein
MHVKQAHTYFFEYLEQMTDSGFTVEDGKMSTFIYDQVLPPRVDPSPVLEEAVEEELSVLPLLLNRLPPVIDRSVCIEQLQEMWIRTQTTYATDEIQIVTASP